MADGPESFPRRTWLLQGLQASIAATVVAIFYPAIRFLWPRPATRSGAMEKVADFRVNELKPDGEQWPARFTIDFDGKPCLVIRTAAGEVRAFNAVCTHTDCTVEFRPDKADIFCNCHNGRYDLNGRNVSPPPPRPLELYKVTLRKGKETDPDEQAQIVISRST
jgi:Rieske Fe-S protein